MWAIARYDLKLSDREFLRNLGKLDRKVQEALKAWMPESSNPTAPAEPAKSDEPSIQ